MTCQDGGDGRDAGSADFGMAVPAKGIGGSFLRRLRILDDEAFVRELEACEGLVRRYIGSFIHDPDVADDVFGETVEAAYRYRYRFVAGRGSFSDWATKIALNKIHEYFRGCRIRREVALPGTSQSHQASLGQDEALVAQEDAAMLALSFAALDEDLRAVLRRYYGGSRSIRSIARELGLSEDAVKKRLSRGRQQLRERLQQEDVYRNLSAKGKQAVADLLSEDPQFRDNGDTERDF
jgi:RNA polymerase sigma factor (sigma-70 family)